MIKCFLNCLEDQEAVNATKSDLWALADGVKWTTERNGRKVQRDTLSEIRASSVVSLLL
jgi:formylmethanofuran:tetrahydromethanopterin formyltransferase